MQFSDQWLRTWVNPCITTEELGDTLTMADLEVENFDPAFTGVVVGKILSMGKHPDPDKLNVGQVDAGMAEFLHVI